MGIPGNYDPMLETPQARRLYELTSTISRLEEDLAEHDAALEEAKRLIQVKDEALTNAHALLEQCRDLLGRYGELLGPLTEINEALGGTA